MRRRTPGVLAAEELMGTRGDPKTDEEVAELIATYEPLVTERRRARLNQILDLRLSSVTVAFDAPHDPHNGAAVMRSCEAFGVSTLHVVERKESFLAAASVSRGSEKWVDVAYHKTSASAIERLRADGMVLVGAHPEGELLPEDLAAIPRLALILGNERDGIADDLAAACTKRVQVPMRGFIESLNVSVTAAILLASATRGRTGDLDEPSRRRIYARSLFLSVPKAERHLADAVPEAPKPYKPKLNGASRWNP